jgi:hypothetical protein
MPSQRRIDPGDIGDRGAAERTGKPLRTPFFPTGSLSLGVSWDRALLRTGSARASVFRQPAHYRGRQGAGSWGLATASALFMLEWLKKIRNTNNCPLRIFRLGEKSFVAAERVAAQMDAELLCPWRAAANSRSTDNFQSKQLSEHCVRGQAGDETNTDCKRDWALCTPSVTKIQW